MRSFLAGLASFLRTRKRLWLLPLTVFIIALALLLYMVSQRSALAPFIYSDSAPPIARPSPAS